MLFTERQALSNPKWILHAQRGGSIYRNKGRCVSKFEKLINQEDHPTGITPTIASIGSSFGYPTEKTLSCVGDAMTGSTYTCSPVECEAPSGSSLCGNPVGYIIHPSYEIFVGKDKDIPLDLVFTPLPTTFRQKGTFQSRSLLQNHDHSTGDAYEVICNKCGTPYPFFKGKFGGFIAPMGESTVSIKIPKNRVEHITTVPAGYESTVK